MYYKLYFVKKSCCCSVTQSFLTLYGLWTAACQDSLSSTVFQNLLKLMPIDSMMPSNHLILCRPFSSFPCSFPASGSLQMSQLFVSGGQSIGVSASTSVFPMNVQGWLPLGLTSFILLSKELSRVFSSTIYESIDFSVLSLLYGTTLWPNLWPGSSRETICWIILNTYWILYYLCMYYFRNNRFKIYFLFRWHSYTIKPTILFYFFIYFY